MPLTEEERQKLLKFQEFSKQIILPHGEYAGPTEAGKAFARAGLQTLPMLGATAGMMVAPEFEIPAAAGLAAKALTGVESLAVKSLASGAGGALGRATQQGLLEGRINPQDVAQAGKEYTIYPALYEASGAVPFLSRIKQLRPGTVLGSSFRGGLASGVMGGSEGGLAQALPQAGLGAVGAGVLQGLTNLHALHPIAATKGRFVQQSEQELTDFSHDFDLETRRGGGLEGPIQRATDRRAKIAWAPMKQLINAIKEPIPLETLARFSQQRVGDDPQALAELDAIFQKGRTPTPLTGKSVSLKGGASLRGKEALSQEEMALIMRHPESQISVGGAPFKSLQEALPPGGISYTAQELENLSTALGEKIAKAAREGRVAPPASDRQFINARSVIADALEAHAPEELKGSVRLAKNQWEDFVVGWRNPLKQFFQPGRSMEAETKPALDLFERVAKGSATPSEMRFIQGGKLPDGRTVVGFEQEIGRPIVAPLQALGATISREQLVQKVARMLGPIGLVGYLVRWQMFRGLRRTQ